MFRRLALNLPRPHDGRRQKTVHPRIDAFCLARNVAVQMAKPREYTRRT
jgi:hypothetical protein